MIVLSYDSYFVGKYDVIANDTIGFYLRIPSYIKIITNSKFFFCPKVNPPAYIHILTDGVLSPFEIFQIKKTKLFYECNHFLGI
jgi:hypothetical protein